MIGDVGKDSMHISAFIFYLFEESKAVTRPKGVRMERMLNSLLQLVSDFVEVERKSPPWDTIDHVDLGVQQSLSKRCRRITSGYRFGLVKAARAARGKGVKRPNHLMAGMALGKKARTEVTVPKNSSGYRCELHSVWNYWLCLRQPHQFTNSLASLGFGVAIM